MNQEKKSEISRQKIIDAAIQEFNEQNFFCASISRICRTGGFSKGRLFYHFPNKEELFCACLEYCFTELGKHMENFEVDVSKTLEESLLHLHDHWQLYWKQHDQMGIFMEARKNPPPALRLRITAIRRETFVKRLKIILREIVKLHYPQDPKRQSMIVGFWITLLDFTAVALGISKLDLYDSFEDYMRSQSAIFKKLLYVCLYGIDSKQLDEIL